MKGKKTPLRTCVACRRESDKRELVRFVRTPDGEVRVDPTGKANGRGAYVCADPACFESAASRKRFASALRIDLSDNDTDRLRNDYERLLAESSPTGR